MLFNVGGYEILVIAVLALIFIGPEQLPTVMRKVGGYAASMRAMAQNVRDEFMAGVDDLPDDLKDLRDLKDLKSLTSIESWMGKGTDDDPIVPRGYADSQQRTQAALAAAAAADAAQSEAGPAATEPTTGDHVDTGADNPVAPAEPLGDVGGESAPATPAPPGSAPQSRPEPFSQPSTAGAWRRDVDSPPPAVEADPVAVSQPVERPAEESPSAPEPGPGAEPSSGAVRPVDCGDLP